MDATQHNTELLSMFAHPAFLVKDGIIIAANKAAQDLQITESTSVSDILASGQDEYKAFSTGTLSLTVSTGPVSAIAAVVRTGDFDYFHLSRIGENSDLRTLALASQQLRDPLTNISALAESLIPNETEALSEKDQARVALFHQNLHRILRLVGNMSDSYNCTERVYNMEHLNICAVITDAVHNTQQLLDKSAAKLTFTSNDNSVISLADHSLLGRAVYNMLSNAIRFADPNSEIIANLRVNPRTVCFTVENDCQKFTSDQLGTMFFRYRRVPTITDGGCGLGLGIPMIQAIASAHNGSLLATIPEPGKVRFCLSLPIRKSTTGILRDSLLRPDYTGGYDHGLIELSDVLPSDAYK